MIPKF